MPALESLTWHPVLARYRRPGEAGKSPSADAVIVAPATYIRSIHGQRRSRTHTLGLLAELISSGVPITVSQFVNTSPAASRVFGRLVQVLRKESVKFLLGEGRFVPHLAETGEGRPETFPWESALNAVEWEPSPPASSQSICSTVRPSEHPMHRNPNPRPGPEVRVEQGSTD
ncbi:hypothetical protein ABH926_003225 [Catenulispora sp. GP43]|uniref:flavoprotein n=1 Tax=Catenulispora sp. GP43 TaxID=3156263 RepID=UPI003516FB3C